jgi:2-C-methyl-D-erythritol 2,4-cyclodiphosphate synthase
VPGPPLTPRAGIGFDLHRFGGPGRALVLGGVEVPGHPGLEGHSDADVVAHALCDAVLGAAGLGDLGAHFPEDDPRWEGAEGLDLLGRVAALATQAGWSLGNADCTVVLERPRLFPYLAEMARRLSAAAGGPVSVKATRPEGLGPLGQGAGVACLAVALLSPAPR